LTTGTNAGQAKRTIERKRYLSQVIKPLATWGLLFVFQQN